MDFCRLLVQSFSFFPIFDDEDISAYDALKQSAHLMKGHKLQLFLLGLLLSIIMAAISIVTLGIGLLFLLPYFYSVHANFYDSLTEDETTSEATESKDDYLELS